MRLDWCARTCVAALLVLAGCESAPPAKSIRITESDIPAERARTLAERMARERERIRDYWGGGFTGPVRVAISRNFRIGKALVPAWRGDRGRVEIPTRTVRSGTPPTLHELVHVEAPNGSRLLAEGLAVYLQTRLGGAAAFPNFGRDLHYEAHRTRTVGGVAIRTLDAVATPDPLAGPEKMRVAYLAAGSFVRFLIETHGKERFRKLYAMTPFRPGRRVPVEPKRYRSVYGKGLDQLARDWRRSLSW